MPKPIRVLVLGATLAAMNLASMITVLAAERSGRRVRAGPAA